MRNLDGESTSMFVASSDVLPTTIHYYPRLIAEHSKSQSIKNETRK